MKRSMYTRGVSVFSATFFALLLLTGLPGSASGAQQIFATSYDLHNGAGNAGYGNVTLYDDSYNGSGNKTQAYASLSGGLGDLTDGVAATLNWGDCHGASPCISGNDPFTGIPYNNAVYVGWKIPNLGAPAVTFHFAPNTNIDEVDISMNYGFHANPVTFLMGGATVQRSVSSVNTGPANQWYDFTGLGLNGDALTITFSYNPEWVLASEVQFFSAAPAIPEPESYAMLLAGLGLLGFVVRRRKQ